MSGVGADFFNKEFDLLDAIKKADQGDTRAMYSVITYISMVEEEEQDLYEKKLEYIHKLIESGDEAAYIMLGDCYRDGKGVPKSAEKAMAYFQKAVDGGIHFGNECIGQMYFFGKGIDQDYEKAYEYLSKNGDSMGPESRFWIGEMYRKGLYLRQDDEEAIEMYDSIIEMDNSWMDDFYPLAAYMLAKYTLEGFDTGYDLEWAKKATEYVKQNANLPHALSEGEVLTLKMVDELWQEIYRELEEH